MLHQTYVPNSGPTLVRSNLNYRIYLTKRRAAFIKSFVIRVRHLFEGGVCTRAAVI